ncbi:cyclin-like protein [Pluteus cervinus]|uniref:Cyclin-like protein n=1 Tax=Pluteus cervinus TaxID=181527 RepID=A0ACD3BFX2_9AGAR|nr:cyclin-like protein [Pluteus cervinus]
MLTAATWFHRFYMRYSLEDFHRQDVAASCIFLATKTEECGRKLRDVARICQAKITGVDPGQIAPDSKEVDQSQTTILLTEEVLLEALCFDFVVENPHAELVGLFDSCNVDPLIQEYAWSLAHDSYRTPLCILYPPKVIAAACYILAQRIYDGPNSPSLDARISASAPSASLPTPPTHKPPSPDASRFAIEHYSFNEAEVLSVSEALNILLEFYSVQEAQPHLQAILSVPPPTSTPKLELYVPAPVSNNVVSSTPALEGQHGRTPNSSHGGNTPINSVAPNGPF